jgi:muramoyltetrapeptide carboxypeptidase
MLEPLRPPPLRAGARIALVAPAGPLAEGAVDDAVHQVRSLGWEPVEGRHVRGRSGFLSAPDAARIEDLQNAIDADDLDAIWCLRGGYGTMRIVDRIDWAALRQRPRALIGFSDNTVLHLAALRAGLATFHGPHAAAPLGDFARAALVAMLTGTTDGSLPAHPERRPVPVAGGVAEGRLVGGNLALVCATLGTPYATPFEGAILFLEDVGEPAYRIDRMLSQLRLAGALDAVGGIALGAFSECPDEGDPSLPSSDEVLRDRLGGLGIPVLADLPFGHVPDNLTIPVGIRARVDADAGTITLLERPVDES